MDDWPKINVERFAGESHDAYTWRAARLIAVVNRFRRGAHDAAEGEKLDQELEILMDPAGDHNALRRELSRLDAMRKLHPKSRPAFARTRETTPQGVETLVSNEEQAFDDIDFPHLVRLERAL